jgi:hypothetical protein
MRHTGEQPVVFWADEGQRQIFASLFPSRTEDLWSPIPLSLTFADRLVVPARSDREAGG